MWRPFMVAFFVSSALTSDADASSAHQAPRPRATTLRITVLSTMLSGDPARGIGEWGFAALVEVDGRKVLFDAGARPETVLRNADELRIDLSAITDVVISHNHGDHTGGLVTLRRELSRRNPGAIRRVHVAAGIFTSRPGPNGQETNGLLPLRAEFERLGGEFVVHDGPVELLPGVWFTGPVPRVHPERNWGGLRGSQPADSRIEDIIPEDASLVIDTADGLVILTGCGHAGVINTADYARRIVRPAPVHAIVGGLHLFAATDEVLAWTAGMLRDFGLRYLLGAHCTGIEAVFRIREIARLDRRSAVVSAVGSSFTLGTGIEPRLLAR